MTIMATLKISRNISVTETKPFKQPLLETVQRAEEHLGKSLASLRGETNEFR